jgi:hypothetical protein
MKNDPQLHCQRFYGSNSIQSQTDKLAGANLIRRGAIYRVGQDVGTQMTTIWKPTHTYHPAAQSGRGHLSHVNPTATLQRSTGLAVLLKVDRQF